YMKNPASLPCEQNILNRRKQRKVTQPAVFRLRGQTAVVRRSCQLRAATVTIVGFRGRTCLFRRTIRMSIQFILYFVWVYPGPFDFKYWSLWCTGTANPFFFRCRPRNTCANIPRWAILGAGPRIKPGIVRWYEYPGRGITKIIAPL